MVSNTSSFDQDVAEAQKVISDGAHAVGEWLGLVEGETELIPGDPARMGAVAEHLSTLGAAFERAGQGFKAIDAGGWRGAAAEGFQGFLETCPPRWFNAADAFSESGAAVRRYQEVLADAQRRAAEAKAQLQRANAASEAAAREHNAAVDRYNAQVQAANQGGPPPGPAPGAFTDPGQADRADAERTIREAKAAVQQAGAAAARTVVAAAHAAPAEPGMLTKLKANFLDNVAEGGRFLGSVAAGAGEALAGVVQMARMVNPLDPYRVTHPAQANEAAATLAAGLATAVQDPYGAVKAVVNVDGWRNEPGRTLGSMIPDAVASLAGGAGVASRLTSGVRKLAEGGEKLAKGGEKLAGKTHPDPVRPAGHQPTPGEPQRPHTPERAEPAPQRQPGAVDPHQRFQETLDQVRAQGGDGIGFGDQRHHFDPGTDHLPDGLSRENPDPYQRDAAIPRGAADDPNFVYRNVDPADENNALWRVVRSDDLDRYFTQGAVPHAGDGHVPADVDALSGHLAGNTGNSRFVSTSDSLEHVLARGQAEPDTYGGLILKLRTGGGIDADATMHDFLGNSPYGHVSHGEREITLQDGAASRIIEGAYRPTSWDSAGRPTGYEWVPNPNFDQRILQRGPR